MSAADEVRAAIASGTATKSDDKHEQPKPRRWVVPLSEFLGDEEPSDDDSEDWIIRDIIPRGEAAIIAGPPKGGKTWAMLSLANDVALGLPWLGTFANTLGPARVVVLAYEDGQRRLRKRLWELCRARGISPNDPKLTENLSIAREPLRLPHDKDEREFAANLKTWKPALVLVDNLTRVMAGDQNSIKDAKPFGDTWVRLCTDVGASIVFLHHTKKAGQLQRSDRDQGDPFESVRGSGDLVAATRHVVLMRPLEGDANDNMKISDVRMRGNLDLTREDFILGFERSQVDGKHVAKMADRGDGAAFKAELSETQKVRNADARKAKTVAEFHKRRDLALEVVHRTGKVSSRTLALASGHEFKDGTALSVLNSLVDDKILMRDGQNGFVLSNDAW